MRIISRYLLVEFASASALVFLALSVTWMAADSVLHIDMMSSGFGHAFRQILFRMLEVVSVIVPLSCLAGVVWSLSRAVRYREITAIRCGGVRLRSVLAPVLVLCFVISGLLLLFEDRVLIPTRNALLEAESGEDEYGQRRPRYINGRWWYASGASVFSAAEYLAEERTLRDVTVFEFDGERHLEQRIDAERAVNLTGSTWEFHDIRVYEFTEMRGLSEREVSILRVDLGLSGKDLAGAAPPVTLTSLHKLARHIRKRVGNETALAGLQVGFHSRLAQPLGVLVLVLLALPFAIGDVERGDSLPSSLLLALAAAAAYWLAWTLALLAGQSGQVPAALPVWGVTVLFLGVGVWRFRRISE